MFCSIPPHASTSWQESGAIAGEKGRSLACGYCSSLPVLPVPTSVLGNQSHLCPLHRARTPGARCSLPMCSAPGRSRAPHAQSPPSAPPVPPVIHGTPSACPAHSRSAWGGSALPRAAARPCPRQARSRCRRRPSPLHVLPPPPRRFRGRGLGEGADQGGVMQIRRCYAKSPLVPRGRGHANEAIAGIKPHFGAWSARRGHVTRGGVAGVRRCARAVGARRRRRQRGEGGRGWEKPGRERAEKLGISASLELINPTASCIQKKNQAGKNPPRAEHASRGRGEVKGRR